MGAAPWWPRGGAILGRARGGSARTDSQIGIVEPALAGVGEHAARSGEATTHWSLVGDRARGGDSGDALGPRCGGTLGGGLPGRQACF
eukprot:8291576-Alexandrium_andersonii.AAC.1